ARRCSGVGRTPLQGSSTSFQAEGGIRDLHVTGVQTCALPILSPSPFSERPETGCILGETAGDFTLGSRDDNRQAAALLAAQARQIGRASCRERGESAGATAPGAGERGGGAERDAHAQQRKDEP